MGSSFAPCQLVGCDFLSAGGVDAFVHGAPVVLAAWIGSRSRGGASRRPCDAPADPVLWSAAVRRAFPLLLLLVGAGCANPCDRMCDAKADLQEACFAQWGSSWAEEGYEDRGEWLGRCYAVWGDSVEDLSRNDPDRSALEDRCARELAQAQADLECDALLLVEP